MLPKPLILVAEKYVTIAMSLTHFVQISSGSRGLNDPRDLYLGLLYPTEDYQVYGYVTNTKVKFVIVVESSNTQLRDSEIRTVSTFWM